MTDAILQDIRADEGWKPHAYNDTRGFLTIGYGFLIDARKGAGLPKPVAEFWLRYLVNEKLEELQRRWPPFEKQPEEVKRALANMAYQLGVSGLLNFRRMLTSLAQNDREEAALHALDSAWAQQTPDRARRVATLIRGL